MAAMFDPLQGATSAICEPFEAIENAADLDDAQLLTVQRLLAEQRSRIDVLAAQVAAEIAHRSRPELGHAGLAWRSGFRTPHTLVQSVTGGSSAEVGRLLRVGALVAESSARARLDQEAVIRPDGSDSAVPMGAPEQDPPNEGTPEPWDGAIGHAVADGRLTIGAADAIRKGLGEVGPGLSETAMHEAVLRLIGIAQRVHVDELWRAARAERDEIDPGGIAERERRRRVERYLRVWRRPDGMTRVDGLLDPESAQVVTSAFDAVTSPRRGGPRFTSTEGKAWARQLLDDPRSMDQLMADTLVDIVQLAVRKDRGALFGATRPSVRLVVTEEAVSTGRGYGIIDGQPDPVSMATVERHLCGGVVPVLFDDDGQCVNVGRDRRLFSRRQRDGLGVRDGGCMWPGCDRQVDWCEAHHIDEWARDHGNTDIADGILLCRADHMRLHEQGWRILRRGGGYRLRPDGGADDGRDDVPLNSRSRITRAIQRVPARAGGDEHLRLRVAPVSTVAEVTRSTTTSGIARARPDRRSALSGLP